MSKSETLPQQQTRRLTAQPPAQPRARRPRPAAATAPRRVVFINLVVPVGVALIAVLFTIWQLVHLRGYTYGSWQGTAWSDYDEGVYLVSARSLLHGEPIFSQVFSSQPPLFLAELALALQLAAGAAGAGHLFSLACALLTLGGVGWLCWEIAGRWSALLGVGVLALTPGFQIAARAVEAEAPMLAFSSLAVAAAVRYARLGGRPWLVLASLLLAAATMSKLLAVAVAAPIGAAILLRALDPSVLSSSTDRLRTAASRQTRPLRSPSRLPTPSVSLRHVGVDTAIAALCLIVPILLAFLLLAPSDQYDQVIRFHLRASDAILQSKPPNLEQFQTFLGWDPGLFALAAVGIAAAAVTRRRLALIPLIWLLATVASMARYHPLFIHHLTVLLAPLAALGGLALAIEGVPALGITRRATLALLLGLALVVYAVWLPVSLDHAGSAFVADHNPARAAYIGWLKANTGPGDLVIVDDQTLAVAADRLVPPALTDTSIVRATAGYLPLSLVLDATKDPRVRAVLLTRELLNGHPYAHYRAWLAAHFTRVHILKHDPVLAYLRTGI